MLDVWGTSIHTIELYEIQDETRHLLQQIEAEDKIELHDLTSGSYVLKTLDQKTRETQQTTFTIAEDKQQLTYLITDTEIINVVNTGKNLFQQQLKWSSSCIFLSSIILLLMQKQKKHIMQKLCVLIK